MKPFSGQHYTARPKEMNISRSIAQFNRPFRGVSLNPATAISWFSGLDAKRRRRYTRFGIVAGNALLLLIVSLFIISNRSASQTVRSSTFNSATGTASSVANPLDQLSSAQIALTAAQAARLPELNAVRNQADSDAITLRVIPNDTVAVAKPQIVSTAQKSKHDIRSYVTKDGDTITSVAEKFGITTNSVKWSNNITGNTLTAGVTLAIPPVNGVVYTVKTGDTPASLATRYQADSGQIISYNDAEISGLKPGEQIIIPNGQIAPVVVYASYYSNFFASYGSNGYDYGYCTWYVANKRMQIGKPLPANLGDAWTWDDYAIAAGLPVDHNPAAGAAVVTGSYYRPGHVAYVEEVLPDGSVRISEMNVVRWNVRSERIMGPEEASRYNYIH